MPAPLVPGSLIAFQSITSERGVVDARGRVIHVQDKGDTFFQVGVQFVSLSENARALITRELEGAHRQNSFPEVTHGSLSQPPYEETPAA